MLHKQAYKESSSSTLESPKSPWQPQPFKLRVLVHLLTDSKCLFFSPKFPPQATVPFTNLSTNQTQDPRRPTDPYLPRTPVVPR